MGVYFGLDEQASWSGNCVSEGNHGLLVCVDGQAPQTGHVV